MSELVYGFDETAIGSDYKRDLDVIPDTARPIWEVYMDGTYKTGKLIHSTGMDDGSLHILDGKLSLEIGEPGSFSFSVTPHHIYYNNFTPYKTTVTVYQEGVELFRGRVTRYSTDINCQRQIECEGDLAYLKDVIFPNSEINTKDRKLSDAFGYFISLYNKFGKLTAESPRYFVPGDVSISKASYKVKVSEWLGTEKSETEFTDARSLIDEFLNTFGGYLRTKRKSNGYVALEYISGYTDVNSQELVYGENLLELSIDTETSDLFTVLIPLGNGDSESDEALTIASAATVNDKTVKNATLTHTKGSKWQNRELVWEEGVARHGRVIKQQSFNGINTAKELLERSVAYFRECIAGYAGNYTVKAVDLHYVDPSYRPIYLGQKVRIISDLHGVDTIDQPLTCMRIDYDLSNPETIDCEFDIPFQPITDTFTAKYKKQRDEMEREVKEAKKSAKKANQANAKQNEAINTTQENVESLEEATEAAIEELDGHWGGVDYGDVNPRSSSKPADTTDDKSADGFFVKYDQNGNVESYNVVTGSSVESYTVGQAKVTTSVGG